MTPLEQALARARNVQHRRREARLQSAIALLDQIATQHPTGSDAAKALFEAAHLCRFELDVCRRASR